MERRQVSLRLSKPKLVFVHYWSDQPHAKSERKETEWNSSLVEKRDLELESYKCSFLSSSPLSLILGLLKKLAHIIVANNDSSTTSALNVPVHVNSECMRGEMSIDTRAVAHCLHIVSSCIHILF